MLHRSFLRSSLAAGLGRPIPRQRAGASHNDWAYLGHKAWRYLGVPRDQASLRRGLHPIAPERVIVLTEQRCSGDQHPLTQDLRERFHGKLSAEKVWWIVRLTTVLADNYRIPVERWAVGLAKRESLFSTGLGHGVGLLHQFQDFLDRPTQGCRIANPPADWWLFLFPEGVKWDAFDGRPVFGMIGHVFESLQPGLQLPVYVLTTQAARVVAWTEQEMDPTAWQRLSKLDRISAACRVNATVLGCLAGWRRSYGV